MNLKIGGGVEVGEIVKPTEVWEMMLQAVNPCPSSDLTMSLHHFFSSVCTCNRINNKDNGAQKFQNFKTGAENGGQGRKSLAVSEPYQETARTQSLCPKDNGSIYS